MVDTVVLDKTGTVTEGRMTVTDVAGSTRGRSGHAPAMGRGARTGIRAPRGPSHRHVPQKRSWAPCPPFTGFCQSRASVLGEPSTDIRSQ